MLNGLRRKDPISERARRRVREGDRLQAASEARGVPLSPQELEEALPGISRARAAVERGLPLSLDAPLPAGARMRIDWSNDPAQLYEGIARERAVHSALERLSSRQREIVVQHYFSRIRRYARSLSRWLSHHNASRNCTARHCIACAPLS